MFKKIIAAALATLTITVAGGTALAASNTIDSSKYPNYWYHSHSTPENCRHLYNSKILFLGVCGNWGYVGANNKGQENSYKYISVTTYGLNKGNYYVKKTVNRHGNSMSINSPVANIDENVAKVVFNGQVFYTGEKKSGILQKYLIGSFRENCPIK